MADLLHSAVAWLDGVRAGQMSQSIVYARGGVSSAALSATVGQSMSEAIDAAGFPVQVASTDFILSATHLVLAGETVRPASGDRITWARTTGTETYQVQDSGSGCSETMGMGRMLRIHTRRIED
ncbi:MAG: hypothetical protein IMZ55_04900 [Acidobacteria bacterium]|nr:hypothetical protein [Acidobacteriota bacterium]